VLRIVKSIEGALDQDITNLTWMTDATKKQASTKLHAILDKLAILTNGVTTLRSKSSPIIIWKTSIAQQHLSSIAGCKKSASPSTL